MKVRKDLHKTNRKGIQKMDRKLTKNELGLYMRTSIRENLRTSTEGLPEGSFPKITFGVDLFERSVMILLLKFSYNYKRPIHVRFKKTLFTDFLTNPIYEPFRTYKEVENIHSEGYREFRTLDEFREFSKNSDYWECVIPFNSESNDNYFNSLDNVIELLASVLEGSEANSIVKANVLSGSQKNPVKKNLRSIYKTIR